MSDKKVSKALVLSGGSIKGAFQAGAIAHVLEQGFEPDAIYGTSVGSLNGGFLAERAGRAAGAGEKLDWPSLAEKLEQFWQQNVKTPDMIVRTRGLLELVWGIVRNKFDGLTDTGPLKKLVDREFTLAHVHDSPFDFYACAVDLFSGDITYASNKDPNIIDYIIASAAIPIEMPIKEIGGLPFVDGGAREIAPLKRAIDDGAQEIVCIICQPEKLGAGCFDVGSLFRYAFRLMDIITNELVNNDVKRFEEVNDWLDKYGQAQDGLQALIDEGQLDKAAADKVTKLLAELRGHWRHIDLTVIRPEKEIVLNLLKFDSEQINNIVLQGRDAAATAYPPAPKA